MTITNETFEAFLRCPTKCFLQAQGASTSGNAYADWVRGETEAYRLEGAKHLSTRLSPVASINGWMVPSDFISANWRCAIDSRVHSQNLESRIDVIERLPSNTAALPPQIVPIRFVRANRPNNVDKLMLAFDALVLSETIGRQVDFGRIIHGTDRTSLRIKIGVLAQQARKTIEKISDLFQKGSAPELMLNRHCPECHFQDRCRQQAMQIDELSLFSGMSPEERDRHRRRGIFTINQLSYTFRPRRPPRRQTPRAKPHYFALQALAIRENTVYVDGNPELPEAHVSIYLDIEGLSTSGPYYLIGVLIVADGIEQFHSFWADQPSDEVTVFTNFVELVCQFSNFRVFHYGAYDAAALKLVKPKLAEHLRRKIDIILGRTVNALSIVHQHVYFPTYTNSLKDVGQFIRSERTAEIRSGLESIVWRRRWQIDSSTQAKENLVRYNKEDCFALRRLCDLIRSLGSPNPSFTPNLKTARTDTLAPEERFRASFGPKTFAVPEFEHVSKCAYFDYQREKVIFRTHPHLAPQAKTRTRIDAKKLRPNTTVLLPEGFCPKCGSTRFKRHNLGHYFLVDLKFMKSGVKKFISKVCWWNCRCVRCQRWFSTGVKPKSIKFGRSLQVWCTYWSVVRGLHLGRIRSSLEDLFGISTQTSNLCRFRRSLSLEYEPLYNAILKYILLSPVVHIDETTVHLQDQKGYVWVLAGLDSAFFLYRPNREGAFLSEMLSSFPGVLVSDFYGAYDSLSCPQQKCLVHFVRDIDDDVLKNPFDEELKTIAQEFSNLLQPIIKSVDRFGLRKRHLRKHRKSVNRFLSSLQSRNLISPIAKSYKQRLEKSGAKMFTFLDYDAVPWNNNYAEHAIKRFAKYRRVFDGLYTEESLNEYLVLASVLTTCEFNNIDRLKFLLSQEKSLEGLLAIRQGKARKRVVTPRALISEISKPQEAGVTPAGVGPGDQPMVRVNCMDSNWKHRCKTLLKARQELEVLDFDADRDRDWAHSLARRYGAKCRVRKRIGRVIFTFGGRWTEESGGQDLRTSGEGRT
jgi:predicted RecB family nuclease